MLDVTRVENHPMTTTEEKAIERPKDEEPLAFHEAAHAVAMWKLDHGIGSISIDPDERTLGHTRPARTYDLESARDPRGRRYIVEQNAIVLHAGSVAEQLLRPGNMQTGASIDHDQIHEEMYRVEDDGSIHITWCNYLWQRAYTLLAWPGQWKLIVALARALLTYRKLDGRSAEFYLKRADDVLRYDPSMPNAVLIGEVTYVCSPWHRTWHSKSVETTTPPKRTELPERVENMEPTPDLRPVRWALEPLSTRAQRCIENAGIRSVMDLAYWSPSALGWMRGAGKLTVQEIVDAAARAGVHIAPDDAPLPWVADPERWRR
jgi:hypothetical protein